MVCDTEASLSKRDRKASAHHGVTFSSLRSTYFTKTTPLNSVSPYEPTKANYIHTTTSSN